MRSLIRFCLTLTLCVAALPLCAQETVSFKFRVLHAEFDYQQDARGNRVTAPLELYYFDGQSMQALRTEPWIATTFAQYTGSPAFSLYVKDARSETGYRAVTTTQIGEQANNLLLIVNADTARESFRVAPVFFTPEQLETPGLHAFNLSRLDLKVTMNGQQVVDLPPGETGFLGFPPDSKGRIALKAAANIEGQWKVTCSTKRRMNTDEPYFGILCQPREGRSTFEVKLFTCR